MIIKKIMLVMAVIATATALVVGTSSFDKKPVKNESPKTNLATTYFHFSGTSGQEGDVTKWDQITALQYSTTYSNCINPNDGCKLQTTKTQMISGTLRPQQVDVVISGTHTNPITSSASGVTAVGNANP